MNAKNQQRTTGYQPEPSAEVIWVDTLQMHDPPSEDIFNRIRAYLSDAGFRRVGRTVERYRDEDLYVEMIERWKHAASGRVARLRVPESMLSETGPRSRDHSGTEAKAYDRYVQRLQREGYLPDEIASSVRHMLHPDGRRAVVFVPPERRAAPRPRWPGAVVAAAQTLMLLAMAPLAASPVPPPLAGSLPTTLALLATAPALWRLGARGGAVCALLAGAGWAALAARALLGG